MSFDSRSVRLIWEATANRRVRLLGRFLAGIFFFIWGLGIPNVFQKFPEHGRLVGGFYTLLGVIAFYAIRFIVFTLRLNQLQGEEERRIISGFVAELPSEKDLKFLNRQKEK